jgi:hypothetical protein
MVYTHGIWWEKNNNNKWRKSMCAVFATHGIHPWFFVTRGIYPWYLKNKIKQSNNEKTWNLSYSSIF